MQSEDFAKTLPLRTEVQFQSMKARRISDMTELWNFAADLERENDRLKKQLFTAETACFDVFQSGNTDAAIRLARINHGLPV